MSPASPKTRTGATLAIVSLALFMVVLDNLVVTVALPAIREDLGATLQSLEWTINAYTLAFAVMLIPGAALGDRFGRRRLFLIGLSLFTASSAAAALAPTTGALVAARALQGVGGAIVAPLTLTLLANAFPEDRRGAALGIWSGISGTGVALGPIVGGAVVDGISWHWIFWINVPIGLALLPVAARVLRESHGPSRDARPARPRPGLGRPLRARLRPRPRAGRGLDDAADRRRRWPSAPCCWRPSSPGSCAPSSRWSRWASSASAPSRSPTPCRSSCTSGPSARSSCSPRCCSTCSATRPSRPGCACCCGPGPR